MKTRDQTTEPPSGKMALFMHGAPANERPLDFVPGVHCLKSWIDRDAEVRHTLIEAPVREVVERAWPDAEVVELFGDVQRWVRVEDIPGA